MPGKAEPSPARRRQPSIHLCLILEALGGQVVFHCDALAVGCPEHTALHEDGCVGALVEYIVMMAEGGVEQREDVLI